MISFGPAGKRVADAAVREHDRHRQHRGHGRFEDVSAATRMQNARSAMGVAVFDADVDGKLDLFYTNFRTNNALMLNRLAKGFFSVVLSGTSYLSQSPFELHFGLGRHERVRRVAERFGKRAPQRRRSGPHGRRRRAARRDDGDRNPTGPVIDEIRKRGVPCNQCRD